jgi:hypothetical protein
VIYPADFFIRVFTGYRRYITGGFFRSLRKEKYTRRESNIMVVDAKIIEITRAAGPFPMRR